MSPLAFLLVCTLKVLLLGILSCLKLYLQFAKYDVLYCKQRFELYALGEQN